MPLGDAGAIRAGDAYVAIGGRLTALDKAMAVAGARLTRWTKRMAKMAIVPISAGAAIIAPLALATKAAAAFEEQMAEVYKVTSAPVAEGLRVAIREMARTMPLTHEQLTTLTADTARFGIEGSKNIQAFVETTARMGVATNLSVEEAGQALAKLVRLTRTPVEQVENLGAAVNELGNRFATSADEIVRGSLRAGAALSQLGVREADILGLVAGLNEVSASAERGGTRLRRVAQELMDPDKMKRLAKAMGMQTAAFRAWREEAPLDVILAMSKRLAEGTREAEKLGSALSAQAQQALAGIGQNLERTTAALGTSRQAFKEATSLQREYDIVAQTTAARLTILRNNVRDLAIMVGDVFLPAVGKAIDWLARMINRLRGWLAQNKDVIVGVAKLGVLLLGVGAALLTVALLMKVVALAFSPWTMILVAVWALADALTGVDLGFQRLVGSIRIGGAKIETWLTALVLHVSYQFSEFWNQLRSGADRTWTWIREGLDWLVDKFEGAVSWIREIWHSFFSWLAQTWDRVTGAIASVIIRVTMKGEAQERALEELEKGLAEKLEGRQLDLAAAMERGEEERDRIAEAHGEKRDAMEQAFLARQKQRNEELAKARERLATTLASTFEADLKAGRDGKGIAGAMEEAGRTWEEMLSGIGKNIGAAFAGGGAAQIAGTFQAFATWGMGVGAGNALDRTAAATEKTAENTERIEEEVREGSTFM